MRRICVEALDDYSLRFAASPEELSHGDVVVCRFSILFQNAEHWGLFDKENNKSIQVGPNEAPSSSPKSKARLMWSSGKDSFVKIRADDPAEFFSTWKDVFRVEWKDSDVTKRAHMAIVNARKQVGQKPVYWLLPSAFQAAHQGINCESFVRECFDGMSYSTQAEKFWGKLDELGLRSRM